MTISPNARTVFRNYVMDGVPSSGNHNIKKADERTWGTALESAIEAYSSGAGSIAKATRALLYADLAHVADVMAWVYADSTVDYNGIYRKSYGSGSGSWTRILDLPYDVTIATDAGAGTANAIVATSSVPVSESALILLNVFEANTATTVTVAFNGGSALTIKTAAGNDVVIGGLVSGMALLGKITGSTFRMVSDQASAAIQAAAEAAQAAAEDAQAGAEAALDSVTGIAASKMDKAANLSDVDDISASRDNLGLGTAAQQNVSAFATAAQGAKADSALQPAGGALSGTLSGQFTGFFNAFGGYQGIRFKQASETYLRNAFTQQDGGTGVFWQQFNPATGAYVRDVFSITDTGVMSFGVRPTFGGVGLATLSEVGSGGTSGVASFNGRSGTVTPASGDYTSAQIAHGAGSVSSALTDVYNKLSFTSPEALGLVGDGTTDNSAAWTAAMAALSSRGVILVWPAKQYYFASTIEANKAVYHIGAPNTASSTSYGTEWLFSAAASLLVNKQVGGKYSGIRMRKLAQGTTLLEWKASTVSGETGSSYVTFEECLISGSCTVATVYLTNCLLIIFKNCRFFNSYKGGACKVVWLDGSHFGVSGDVRTGDNVDNIEFLTCVATGIAKVSTSDYAARIDGFYLDGKCDSTKFFQCKALWCYYGVILTNSGATTQVPNFTRFAQGGMENNYKNAIYCHKGDITTFSDMYASLDSDADSATLYGNTDVVLVDSAYVGSVEFSACMMRGGKRDAYRLEGGRVQINGGQAANSGLRTTGYSVDILATVTKAILQGLDCTTMATGSTGITTAVRNLKGASGIIINGCDLSGYTTAISGTSTGAGISGNLT